jgi:hypothetical protein
MPDDTIVCLALDVSTKTGWSVLIQDKATQKITLKEYGVEKLPMKIEDYGIHPWYFIYAARAQVEQLTKLVIKAKPDVIVIEDTTRGRARFSQKILEYLHCTLLISLDKYRNDLQAPPVFYLSPSEWRKKLGLVLSKTDKQNNKLVNKAAKTGVSKKDLGLKGKIGKKHISVRYVNEHWGLDLKMNQNDSADAMCLGQAFLLGARRAE